LRPIRSRRGQWPQRTQEAARSRPISRSDARVEQEGTGTKGNSVLSVASCSSSVSTGRKERGALPHPAIFRPALLVTSVLLAAPPRRSPFACLCVSCGQSVLAADNGRKERKKPQEAGRSPVRTLELNRREQERRGTLFSPLPPVHRPCRPAAKSRGHFHTWPSSAPRPL
jgi:hypothetical protein